jgi:hypothetical protein
MKERMSHTLGRALPTFGKIRTERLCDVARPFIDIAPILARRLFPPDAAIAAFRKSLQIKGHNPRHP